MGELFMSFVSRILLAALLVLGVPSVASAADLRFIITGNGSGMLNGVSFGGPFTVTGTASITDLNPNPAITAYLSHDVTVSGSPGSVAAASPLVVFVNNSTSLFGLFEQISAGPPPVFIPFIYMNSPAFATYGFASDIGPVAGTEFNPRGWPARGLNTDFGRLDIVGPLSDLTFEAKLLGAVPEPATWAMMIVGFGLIGASLRSRRQPDARFA